MVQCGATQKLPFRLCIVSTGARIEPPSSSAVHLTTGAANSTSVNRQIG